MLGNVAKVAIAAWAAIGLEPWVEQTFPALAAPLHLLIAALISALVLELILQLALGWPRLKIQWAEIGEEVAPSEIAARIRPSHQQSQVFRFTVIASSGGWLGYRVLRACMGEARLQVRIDQALIVPTRESCSKKDGNLAVQHDESVNGFTVNLGDAPRKPGVWYWADVSWRDEGTPPEHRFNIEYVFLHERALMRCFLNMLIWRSSNARSFRVQVGT